MKQTRKIIDVNIDICIKIVKISTTLLQELYDKCNGPKLQLNSIKNLAFTYCETQLLCCLTTVKRQYVWHIKKR